MVLRRERPPDTNAPPVFLALPAPPNGSAPSKPNNEAAPNSSSIIPLYEYRHIRDGHRFYSTRADLADPEQQRSPEPLCKVWRNPMTMLILDAEALATP